ncbi:conserved hypothetical protein [Culex quinquefasciatus]|uniref:Uncharacterized protein n=1 Tax=Culex quinquefasciatus TaxID=7176 RepID=B0WEA3_CULQU|nr:conserved hypothetical protein [Culex quinquefasciatus]|eukprot:XP_001847037.1 conserved hypothetical protein [Culex quinquefasciatus]
MSLDTDSRDSSPDITGDADDDDMRSSSAPPMSPRMDSEPDRPHSGNNQMHHSMNTQSGSNSAGTPSPGLKYSHQAELSPSPSVTADSPIEVGGPISLTTSTRADTSSPLTAVSSGSGNILNGGHSTATTAGGTGSTTHHSFSSHLFGSFGERTNANNAITPAKRIVRNSGHSLMKWPPRGCSLQLARIEP